MPTNSKQGNLLTGLIHDEHGKPLYPTYTTKNGRRYRYYISRSLADGADKSGNGWRVPAGKIEQVVLTGLAQFLKDKPRLIDALGLIKESPGNLRHILDAASGLAERIADGKSVHCAESLRALVQRVELASGHIRIEVSQCGLSDLLGVTDSARRKEKPFSIDLPIVFRQRGVESKIILQASTPPLASDENLIALVGRTRQWFDWIVKGEVATIREIAQKEGVDEGDVSRFMPLAFLAPDIVDAILAGRQPLELTAERLKRLQFLPHSWEDQRHALGFPA